MHKEHCLLAMEAGKHVLCEKALAKNVADAREMYAAAERNGVMLQDGVWTRFFPAVEHARSLIESGEIGDVVMVQSDFESLTLPRRRYLLTVPRRNRSHTGCWIDERSWRCNS